MTRTLTTTTALALVLATSAYANDSTISQIGATNFATVDQTGGNNGTSNVNQTGSDDFASVTQSDGPGGSNNADIDQLGGSGVQTATITQSNGSTGGSSATVGTPGGPTNNATILQDSVQGGNEAVIDQDGDGNSAWAQQGPGAAFNVFPPFGGGPTTPGDITNSFSIIDQNGSSNMATTMQIVGSNGGDNNLADILQSGTSNEAAIKQGTGAINSVWFIPNPASNDNNNTAFITQSGVGNFSDVEQGGESGSASSTQGGNDNESTIVQSGGLSGLGNSANAVQSGDRNTSTIVQSSSDGDLPGVPAGTTAEVFQDGNDNNSMITQRPLGGHFADVSQVGDMLTSTITQDGLLNTSLVTQELANNTSTIEQNGGGIVDPLFNLAEVNQVATAGNTSFVSQSGAFNVSTVNQ